MSGYRVTRNPNAHPTCPPTCCMIRLVNSPRGTIMNRRRILRWILAALLALVGGCNHQIDCHWTNGTLDVHVQPTPAPTTDAVLADGR